MRALYPLLCAALALPVSTSAADASFVDGQTVRKVQKR
jgi:hypothetical protein